MVGIDLRAIRNRDQTEIRLEVVAACPEVTPYRRGTACPEVTPYRRGTARPEVAPVGET